MNKFDIFLKILLQAIFKEYPYDNEKSKTSFEKIAEGHTQDKIEGEANGYKK